MSTSFTTILCGQRALHCNFLSISHFASNQNENQWKKLEERIFFAQFTFNDECHSCQDSRSNSSRSSRRIDNELNTHWKIMRNPLVLFLPDFRCCCHCGYSSSCFSALPLYFMITDPIFFSTVRLGNGIEMIWLLGKQNEVMFMKYSLLIAHILCIVNTAHSTVPLLK